MAVSIVFNNNRELILEGTTIRYVHSSLEAARKSNANFMEIKKNTVRIDQITWIREIKK